MKRQKELAPDRQAVLERIARYESEGGDAFFRDVEEDPPYRTLLPEDVDYLHKTARFRFNGALARAFEAVCGPVVCRQFGLKIKGAKNLERLQGGAVFTANHFFAFENQAVRRAALLAPGRHRFYKIIREGNFFFPGFVGWCMKYTDTLPLSSSLKTSALLGRAVGEILSRGDFILIYPEQAMWWNYDKPRPLRPGAYYYAASNS
ncbi:MAG: 1-acyl-sn-glycerol-3-phosphate acyltransferase, partial [Clostridia bacterium]|nr:1-acyl-sn-glycerol-3-phosphate acyltransferase [Clostridia bacterium]